MTTVDIQIALSALRGVLKSIWTWLVQSNAVQNWARTITRRTKEPGDVESYIFETAIRLRDALPGSEVSKKIEDLISKGRADQATRLFLGYSFRVLLSVLTPNGSRRDEPKLLNFSDVDGGVDARQLGLMMPTDELERDEVRKRVWNAIDRLSNRQKEVIVGRFFDRRSNAELARQLGISESAVRSYVVKGLGILAQLLSEDA